MCYINIFITVFGFIFNVIISFVAKSSGQVFRFYVLIGFLTLGLVLLLDILTMKSVAHTKECLPLNFIQTIYQYIQPIPLFTMLLILCSIRQQQSEDIREEIILKHHKMVDEQDYALQTVKQAGMASTILSVQNKGDGQQKMQDLTRSIGTLFKKK